MRIATLQLAPELGAVAANMARADALLLAAAPPAPPLDILVLPELAFTGYNFASLAHIRPLLEPTARGPSTAWAVRTARRLGCIVVVGYPEVCTAGDTTSLPDERDDGGGSEAGDERRYNAAVAVSPDGAVLAHYRKSFLYLTDETWAAEGPGFFAGELGLRGGAARVAMGICMDINPYRFTAAWGAREFAAHVLGAGAALVLLPMAWLSHAAGEPFDPADFAGEGARAFSQRTVLYWLDRLRPLIERPGREVVVVFANRVGIETTACYAGSSLVARMGGGRVHVLGVRGKGEEAVLVVDTEQEPRVTFQLRNADDDGEDESDGETKHDV